MGTVEQVIAMEQENKNLIDLNEKLHEHLEFFKSKNIEFSSTINQLTTENSKLKGEFENFIDESDDRQQYYKLLNERNDLENKLFREKNVTSYWKEQYTTLKQTVEFGE